MSQNDVVGVLPTMDLLPSAQPGLHYARHVLLLDQPPGATLPPVGRGRAVAAAGGWRAHVGRATLLAGDPAYLGAQLGSADLRAAVVVLVAGPVDELAATLQVLATHHEVHALTVADAALRVVVTDAAQVQVQALAAGAWEPQHTLQAPASAPQAARKRTVRTDAAPQPEAPPQAAQAPTAHDTQAQADAPAADPTTETLAPPSLES